MSLQVLENYCAFATLCFLAQSAFPPIGSSWRGLCLRLRYLCSEVLVVVQGARLTALGHAATPAMAQMLNEFHISCMQGFPLPSFPCLPLFQTIGGTLPCQVLHLHCSGEDLCW